MAALRDQQLILKVDEQDALCESHPNAQVELQENPLRWRSGHVGRVGEAERHIGQVEARFKRTQGRHLCIAEDIGQLALNSIADGEFRGVRTDTGLIESYCHDARKKGARGATDRKSVEGIWTKYRGVVHLGLVIDYLERIGDSLDEVFKKAWYFALLLASGYPKGTGKPYVPPDEKINFIEYQSVRVVEAEIGD